MHRVLGFSLVTILWFVAALIPYQAVAASRPATELAHHLTSIAWLAISSPMQTIPASEFVLGSKRIDDDPYGLRTQFDDTELPQNRVWLDAYEMDRDEVSLGEYLKFLQQRQQDPPDELRKLIWHVITVHSVSDQTLTRWPALYVTWQEAKDFCQARAKRLPTDACFLGERRRRSPGSPCLGNIMSMKSRFSRRWIHTMTAKAPTASITCPATSRSGCKTGLASTITPTCRNETLKARQAGAIRVCEVAPGRATPSCFAPPPAAARRRINDPPRSDFGVPGPFLPTAHRPA